MYTPFTTAGIMNYTSIIFSYPSLTSSDNYLQMLFTISKYFFEIQLNVKLIYCLFNDVIHDFMWCHIQFLKSWIKSVFSHVLKVVNWYEYVITEIIICKCLLRHMLCLEDTYLVKANSETAIEYCFEYIITSYFCTRTSFVMVKFT